MQKPFRHLGVLMISGVVALGLVAAAYTLWYEDLSLNATVSTANFDVDWSCQTAFIDGAGNGNSSHTDCKGATKETVAILATAVTGNAPLDYTSFTDFGGSVPAAKYIQDCSAAITSNASGANGNGGNNNQLTLTANNLYPYAGCKYAIDIDVPTGNMVPAHFTLTSSSNDSSGVVKVIASTTGPDACTQIASSFNTPVTSNAVITTDGTTPLQLHADEHLYCTFLVYLQEEDSSGTTVAEGANFTLSATIKAHQFNETAP